MIMGYTRITDTFVGLTQVQSAFKTSEAQVKLLLRVVKSLKTALKKMQLDKLTDKQVQVRKLVCYVFCFVQEIFNAHWRSALDCKSIKAMQELLCAIGFRSVASRMFDKWMEQQMAAAA